MRSSFIVVVTLISFTLSACATNPARPITPNNEELFINDAYENSYEPDPDGDGPKDTVSPFYRGQDPLDEQEFYEAISDTESYDAVKGSRGAGFALQGVGFTVMSIGIAAALGLIGTYLLSDASNGTPTVAIPDEQRQYFLYGTYASAGVALLGGLLGFGMKGKAVGAKRLFPLSHARQRLENHLYGPNGASPDDIKTVRFTGVGEGDELCFGGERGLTPLEALDARGQHMKIDTRAEWFEWSSSPPGLVSEVGGSVRSPVPAAMDLLDQPVVVTVKVRETGVSTSLTLKNDLGCGGAFTFGGGGYGNPGDSGKHGRNGDSESHNRNPTRGGTGTRGLRGGSGGRGPTVKAEAAWVKTTSGKRVILVAAQDSWTLHDPARGRHVIISAQGGPGGSGGRGGDGGSGGSTHSGSCTPGAEGGDGGEGGEGGSGGPGGTVKLRLADEALGRFVQGSAPGGPGGSGGSGGSAGSGSRGSSCKKGWARDGGRGGRGGDGQRGEPGEEGSVDVDVVNAGDLRLISAVLAKVPQLTLDVGEGEVAPVKKPKRR